MLASPPPQNPIWCKKCCEENNEESLIRAKAFCKYPLWGKVIWSCSFVSEKPLKQCTICSCLVGAGRDLFRQSGLHATARLLTLSATNFPCFHANLCSWQRWPCPAPWAPCSTSLHSPCTLPMSCALMSLAVQAGQHPTLLGWGNYEEFIVRLPETFRWSWKCLWAKWGLFHL